MTGATMSMRDSKLETRVGAAVLVTVTMLVLGSAAWRHNVLWFVRPPNEWPRFVDVSRFQGEIEWRRVARDGVSGAWIKASEGGDLHDSHFGANREGAAAAGLRWGAYHFYTFCRPAHDQAENFLAALDGNFGTLPLAVDVETGGNCATIPAPEALHADLDQFMHEVEVAAGHPMMVYLIPGQVPLLFGDDLPDRQLWVRSLLSAPALPVHPAAVWQFHSRGWVDGIRGPVDLNAVDPATFAAWR